MANDSQELLIKVTVDGKEGIVTLNLTNEQIQELTKSVNSLAAQNGTVFQQITQDILKYNNVTDQSVQTVADWINTVGLSKRSVEEYIRTLQKENETLNTNTEKFHQNEVVITNLSKGLAASIQQHGAFANKANLTTRELLLQNDAFNRGKFGVSQLGYALGDAGTFAIDFRIGMMAIGNNIPFVVQGMQELKLAAETTGVSFGTAFRNAIMGPTGIILAVNIFMTVLTVLLPLLNKTKDKTKELADETERYAQKLKDLSVAELDLEKQRLRIEKAEKERLLKAIEDNKITITFRSQYAEPKQYYQNAGDAEKAKKLNEEIKGINKNITDLDKILPDAQKKLTDILMGKYDLSSIKNIRQAIEILNKELEGAADQKTRDFFKSRINELKKTEADYRGEAEKGKKDDLKIDKKIEDERAKIIIDRYKKLTELNELQHRSNKQNIEETLIAIGALLKLNLSIEDRIALLITEQQLKDNKKLQPTGLVDVPKAPDPIHGMTVEQIRAQNLELAITDSLTGSIRQGWQSGGQAMASAASNSIRLFGQANSILQIFIQTLIQAITQALILKAVTAVLNLIPGFGSTASIVAEAAGAAFAKGGIVTKPTLAMIGEGREPEGIFPLSKLSQFINSAPRPVNQILNIKLSMEPAELRGEGKTLRTVLKLVEQEYRTRR